jgi:hypothetical protein
MPVEALSALTPEARTIAEKYLRDVDAVLRSRDREVAEATAENLRAHLCEVLDPASQPGDVSRLAEELGAPSTFAEAASGAPGESVDYTQPAGRILGVPYDYRPTPSRIGSRIWNPRDPRVFMPHLMGIGWTVNLGAVAVRLHLIEPDAEDEPFAAVSNRAFLFALLVPLGLTALIVGTFLGLRSVLPSMLPTHWNLAGTPTEYGRQGAQFGFLVAMASLPTLWALWAVATQRPSLSRAALIGVASLFSAIAAGSWVLTLVTVLAPPVHRSMPLLSILPGFLVPLAVLLGLARAGRAAEQRRDLGDRAA